MKNVKTVAVACLMVVGVNAEQKGKLRSGPELVESATRAGERLPEPKEWTTEQSEGKTWVITRWSSGELTRDPMPSAAEVEGRRVMKWSACKHRKALESFKEVRSWDSQRRADLLDLLTSGEMLEGQRQELAGRLSHEDFMQMHVRMLRSERRLLLRVFGSLDSIKAGALTAAEEALARRVLGAVGMDLLAEVLLATVEGQQRQ